MSTTATSRGDPPKDWAQVRRRLDVLTALIAVLTAERQKVQAELDTIVYPVLALPPEITSHIFLQCMPNHARTAPLVAPLVLTQICRQWRTIAFATPNLWQSIALERRVGSNNSSSRLLDMWLEHSGSLPLALSFGTLDGPRTQALVDASLIHCSRWREIEITSRASLNGSHKIFPLLHRVTLSLQHPHPQPPPRTILIQDAALLRRATITLESMLTVQLPWNQLTVLHLEAFGMARASCMPILIQCSQLNSLTYLTEGRSDDIATFRMPHVTLQFLHSLGVTHGSPSIIPHLTLPRLRNLVLTGRTEAVLEPFQALVARSSCALQTLSFVDMNSLSVSPHLLRRFYQLFPTVTDFTIRCGPVVKVIATSLFPEDVLPLLQSLTIDAVRFEDDYGTLFRMLHAHTSRMSPLKSFKLILRRNSNCLRFTHHTPPSGPLPKAVTEKLRNLAASGKVKIRVQFVDDSKPSSRSGTSAY